MVLQAGQNPDFNSLSSTVGVPMGVKHQYQYIKYSTNFPTERKIYFKLITLNTISWPVSCSNQESYILSWTSACLHK